MVRVDQIVVFVFRHLEEAHIHNDYLRRVDLLVLERVGGVLEARRGLNTWGSTNETGVRKCPRRLLDRVRHRA